jgi:quercetin dioxygenase-like cupin family protein
MLLKKAREREWAPTDYAGIERSLFRNNETGGRSSFVRLKQGSRFPKHSHQGTEEVVVVSGRVTLGDVAMEEGDYLYTVPGEEHDVVAVTDAVIFVSSQKATPVIEN